MDYGSGDTDLGTVRRVVIVGAMGVIAMSHRESVLGELKGEI